MHIKIVSDSSSNLLQFGGIDYATVPLKIVAGEKEYVDNAQLDVAGMVADLKKFKGKSGSSCPNVQEWLEAFGDAENVFGVTISRNLSGSYNSAQQAAEVYIRAFVEVCDDVSAYLEYADYVVHGSLIHGYAAVAHLLYEGHDGLTGA